MEKTRSLANVLDKSSLDTDDLLHLFCGHCWRKAEQLGWKKRTFCGAQGDVNGDGRKPSSKDNCVVCDEMATRKCVVCGYRPVVIR